MESKKQLEEYFSGNRKSFDLPIVFIRGTDFQKNLGYFVKNSLWGNQKL